MDKLEQQVLALAVVFQGITLVIDIARRGRADPVLVNTCLQGLLKPYQPNVAGIFGGVRALRPGLMILGEQLSQPKDIELTRYAIALLHLESRLRKHPQRLQGISAGLDRARKQVQFFDGQNMGATHAALAALYSDQVSDLRPRIMVVGERDHLDRPNNADLIRALLLATLRAVSMWREWGGRRWDLLLRRRRILQTVQSLLAETA